MKPKSYPFQNCQGHDGGGYCDMDERRAWLVQMLMHLQMEVENCTDLEQLKADVATGRWSTNREVARTV